MNALDTRRTSITHSRSSDTILHRTSINKIDDISLSNQTATRTMEPANDHVGRFDLKNQGGLLLSSNDQRVHKSPAAGRWTIPLHQLTASGTSWQQVAENFQYFITHSRDRFVSVTGRKVPSERSKGFLDDHHLVLLPWTNCSRHDSRRLLTIEFH